MISAVSRMVAISGVLLLTGCNGSFPVLGDPEGGFMHGEALKEAKSMIGTHYDLTGWHQLCPNPDSSVGCKWIENGRFVADNILENKPGYIILHVAFENGDSGFMQYGWHHMGISSIPVEEYLVEKEKARRYAEE